MIAATASPSSRAITFVQRNWWLLLTSVVLAWLIVSFLYVPVLATIRSSFALDGQLSLDAFAKLAESERVRRALVNTLMVSLLTVVLVNIVGVLQVVVLELISIRGERILTVAYAIPLVFSSIAAVSGWNYVYGQNGFVTVAVRSIAPGTPADWFTGMWAVVAVHTFTMTGYHFLFLRTAVRRIDYSTVEAARILGYSPVRAYLSVVLPAVKPTTYAVTLMVLIASLSSFAAPALLGAGEFNMVSQVIQSLVGLQRLDMAALLALLLAVVSAALFVWMRRVERRGSFLSGSKSPTPIAKLHLSKGASSVWFTIAYLLAAVNVLPVLATLVFSFAPAADVRQGRIPSALTLDNYSRVFRTPTVLDPLRNSFTLALLAVVTTVVIATVCAGIIVKRSGRFVALLEYSVFLPWVVPATMVAVGLIAAYSSANALVGGAVLVGSYWLLPVAYSVMLLPIQVRMLSTAWRAVDPSLGEASASLGALPWRRFAFITLPLIAPTLIQVAALGFNEVLGEYTLSVMLYSVDNRPLGVALQAAGAGDSPTAPADATVYIVCLLAVSLAMIVVADGLAKRFGSRTSEVPR